jgi:hypothetical protein
MLAGVSYFAVNVLHDDNATTYLFVCVVAPALLVMPLWRRYGQRVGKLRGYVVASLMITVTTISLVLATVLPAAAVYGLVALLGVGYAGQQLFSLAMLPGLHRLRRDPDRQAPGRRVHRPVDAGETFGLRARARRSSAGSSVASAMCRAPRASRCPSRAPPNWACCSDSPSFLGLLSDLPYSSCVRTT